MFDFTKSINNTIQHEQESILLLKFDSLSSLDISRPLCIIWQVLEKAKKTNLSFCNLIFEVENEFRTYDF